MTSLALALALAGCGAYSPVSPKEDANSADAGQDRPADRDPAEDGAQPETASPSPGDPANPGTPPAANGGSGGDAGSGGSGGSGGKGRAGGSRGNSGSNGSGGSGGTQPGGAPSTPSSPPVAEPFRYRFELPKSDTSVNGNNGPALAALLGGCASAQSYLNRVIRSTGDDIGEPLNVAGGPNPVSWGFLTPRYTVLYMAALLRVCESDAGLSDEMAFNALATYGDQGLDGDPEPIDPATGQPYGIPGYGEPECDLYRMFVSVRDQVPPASIACPGGGTSLVHVSKQQNGQTVWDDPCTFGVVESDFAWTGDGTPPASLCAPVQDLGLIYRYIDPPAPAAVTGEVARPEETDENGTAPAEPGEAIEATAEERIAAAAGPTDPAVAPLEPTPAPAPAEPAPESVPAEPAPESVPAEPSPEPAPAAPAPEPAPAEPVPAEPAPAPVAAVADEPASAAEPAPAPAATAPEAPAATETAPESS